MVLMEYVPKNHKSRGTERALRMREFGSQIRTVFLYVPTSDKHYIVDPEKILTEGKLNQVRLFPDRIKHMDVVVTIAKNMPNPAGEKQAAKMFEWFNAVRGMRGSR